MARRTRRHSSGPSGAGCDAVGQEADRNGPDEAAAELTTVYTTEFEPMERYLLGRSPQSVRPLEVQFNTLRGDLFAGLKGEKLTGRLDGLQAEVEALVNRLEARPAGTFGTAFFESLITIVREGVEVILVLAMLIALVTKATPSGVNANGTAAGLDESRARARALRCDLVGRRAGRRRQPGDGRGPERPGLLDAGPGRARSSRAW